ncbi:hypothetical protein EDB86DRAFT_3099228 [Lactarius hatsudake]|nr:hypothetical protein EDB86DRAFT_3099228 [Lactarius hatsudake]
MLSYGSVAVALVQRRVMVVQASRPHDECERYLDVYTFTPSSERTFLVSDAPCARIDSNDLLAVFDDDDALAIPHDILELPRRRTTSSASCPLARTGALTPFGLRGRASSVEELVGNKSITTILSLPPTLRMAPSDSTPLTIHHRLTVFFSSFIAANVAHFIISDPTFTLSPSQYPESYTLHV